MNTPKFKLAVIFSCFVLCLNAQPSNDSAKIIFEKKINIIKEYINGGDPDTTLKRVGVIQFLEEVTGIQSESDSYGQIGKLDPTINDYKKWNDWYLNNKEKIFWDKNENRIIVKSP